MTTEYGALVGLARLNLLSEDGKEHLRNVETKMQLEGRGLELDKTWDR